MPTRLLLIEADRDVGAFLRLLFTAAKVEVVLAETFLAAQARLVRPPPPAAILFGVAPHDSDPVSLRRALKALRPPCRSSCSRATRATTSATVAWPLAPIASS